MKPGSAGFVEDGGDVGPFEGGAGVDGDAEGGVLAADLQHLGKDAGEGVGKEVKSSNGRFRGLSRERVALLSALEVHNMGRNGRRGKIVQSFVEADMLGCFDSVSFRIVPEDVLGSAGEETEEGAFLGVGHKLGRALAGGMDPDSATKGAKAGKVILFASGQLYWSKFLVTGGERIVDPEVVVERVGPKFDI